MLCVTLTRVTCRLLSPYTVLCDPSDLSLVKVANASTVTSVVVVSLVSDNDDDDYSFQHSPHTHTRSSRAQLTGFECAQTIGGAVVTWHPSPLDVRAVQLENNTRQSTMIDLSPRRNRRHDGRRPNCSHARHTTHASTVRSHTRARDNQAENEDEERECCRLCISVNSICVCLLTDFAGFFVSDPISTKTVFSYGVVLWQLFVNRLVNI